MTKKTDKIGVSLRVDPSLWRQLGSGKNDKLNASFEKDAQAECQNIMDEIKRHVDNVQYVYIEWETEDTCSHCGGYWGETSSEYNGGCCDKDEDNNPSNKRPSTETDK